MSLEGDANDYVGKGMAGGSLIIAPHQSSEFASQETAIIGNTCLYGATGEFYTQQVALESGSPLEIRVQLLLLKGRVITVANI